MASSSLGAKRQPQFADGDAPDVAVNPTQVANYAAEFGNHKVDTAAARIAATSWAWPGLHWTDTDGAKLTYCFTGTTWAGVGGNPICKANASAAQTLSATFAALPFNTESFDSHGMHDNTTNNSRISAPVAGLYRATGKIRTLPSGYTATRFAISGTGFVESEAYTPQVTGAYNDLTITNTFALATGQYVELQALNSAASPSHQTHTYFMLEYVGPTP